MDYEFPRLARSAIDRLVDTQASAIDSAVELITESLADDGVLQVFGTGHARLIVHEMAGRAGGLVPINLLRIADLATYGGRAAETLLEPTLERDPSLAGDIYTLAAPRDTDCFLIASNSGINGSVVEMASIVRDHGHRLIAVTSLRHSSQVASRHPSGKKLYELADVLIDTGTPLGDAGLPIGDSIVVGATSSLVGVTAVQMITEGVCRRLLDRDRTPPVYRSMNVPGSDQANAALEAHYRGRVRPIEP